MSQHKEFAIKVVQRHFVAGGEEQEDTSPIPYAKAGKEDRRILTNGWCPSWHLKATDYLGHSCLGHMSHSSLPFWATVPRPHCPASSTDVVTSLRFMPWSPVNTVNGDRRTCQTYPLSSQPLVPQWCLQEGIKQRLCQWGSSGFLDVSSLPLLICYRNLAWARNEAHQGWC